MIARADYAILIRRDESESDIDISSYVTGITFRYGMTEPFADFAPPARATITVANDSGAFNPDDSDALFYGQIFRGDIVSISMTIDGDTQNLFVGKILSRTFARDFATITVEDQMLQLLASEVRVPLLANVRIDEAILSLFEQQVAVWPYNYKYLTLDFSNLAEVAEPGREDNNVLLGLESPGSDTGIYSNLDLDEAVTTLTFAGDINNAETNAQSYLRDLVMAEGGGRFFWNAPIGKFSFHNRWRDTDGFTIGHSLTGTDILFASFLMDEDLINAVEVNYRPRSASDVSTILFSSPNATTIRTSSDITITANFTDPVNPGFTAAGLEPECVIGTDLIVNTADDGSGENISNQVPITIEFSATSATINIVNTTNDSIYVTKLQIRGKPLTILDQESVEYQDEASIRQYDRQNVILSLPALEDADTALTLAQILVLRQSNPVRRFQTVGFIANSSSVLLESAQLARIGDGVNIQYDDHDGDYVIVGQEHRINPGGSNAHEVTWTLKPADTRLLITLDESPLDGPQILGF